MVLLTAGVVVSLTLLPILGALFLTLSCLVRLLLERLLSCSILLCLVVILEACCILKGGGKGVDLGRRGNGVGSK